MSELAQATIRAAAAALTSEPVDGIRSAGVDGIRYVIFSTPAELTATAGDFMARLARHTRQVTATQKALFETWINSPHAVGLRVSRDEFARVFSYPQTAAQVSAARAGLGRGGSGR